MNRKNLTTLVEVVGMALIVAGIGSFSIPVSVIVAGVAMVVIGAMSA
jgi:hypothetical protein